MTDAEDRLDDLERRLVALERADAPARSPSHSVSAGGPAFWALAALREKYAASMDTRRGSAAGGGTADEGAAEGVCGALTFAGILTEGGTESLAWQEDRPVAPMLRRDWRSAAAVLAALAHPIRLEIVRRLLIGAHTTAELAEIAGLGTSGQLYHHLKELQSAGLVVASARNHYDVVAAKAIGALVIVTAALSGEPWRDAVDVPDEAAGEPLAQPTAHSSDRWAARI